MMMQFVSALGLGQRLTQTNVWEIQNTEKDEIVYVDISDFNYETEVESPG